MDLRTRLVVGSFAVAWSLAAPVAVASAAAVDAGCDDLLVVHRPTGSEGDVRAVAITSQSLDRDVPGWSRVGWEVAADTALRQVLVVGGDDEVTALPGSAQGAEGPVLELRFCGQRGTEATTVAPSAPETPDASATGEVADEGTSSGRGQAPERPADVAASEVAAAATPGSDRRGSDPRTDASAVGDGEVHEAPANGTVTVDGRAGSDTAEGEGRDAAHAGRQPAGAGRPDVPVTPVSDPRPTVLAVETAAAPGTTADGGGPSWLLAAAGAAVCALTVPWVAHRVRGRGRRVGGVS